jgi:hypothetical protein
MMKELLRLCEKLLLGSAGPQGCRAVVREYRPRGVTRLWQAWASKLKLREAGVASPLLEVT